MIRFVHIFNYAEGVSTDDGEAWYLGEHVPQARKLPGVVRYRSWKQFDNGIPFPNAGVPAPFGNVIGKWMNISIKLEQAEDLLD